MAVFKQPVNSACATEQLMKIAGVSELLMNIAERLRTVIAAVDSMTITYGASNHVTRHDDQSTWTRPQKARKVCRQAKVTVTLVWCMQAANRIDTGGGTARLENEWLE